MTGGAGSIGSELTRQLAKKNKVICLDQDETGVFDLKNELGIIPEIADIRNTRRLLDIFEKHRPQIVFHVAAYKHLSEFEGDHFEEIVDTNVIGTQNVIRAAKKIGVKKLVFISTDKAVNPTSLMGTTKLLGEIITKRSGYVVVRFGNVLGSRGSVIPIWLKQIQRGEPITVTDPRMERYFMTIEEACLLVIEAAKIGKSGETLILNMGKPIKIMDLARKILRDTKSNVSIKITGAKQGEKTTEELMTSEEKQRAVKKGKFYIIK